MHILSSYFIGLVIQNIFKNGGGGIIVCCLFSVNLLWPFNKFEFSREGLRTDCIAQISRP